MNLILAESVLGTPYYVLKDKNGCLGPKVAVLQSGAECSPIYGFSEKAHYDKFLSQTQQALTPYPLVKGYLQKQVASLDSCLKLVVVDAAGPLETSLYAVAMGAVLEAYEQKTRSMKSGYRLIFDQQTNVYRVDES